MRLNTAKICFVVSVLLQGQNLIRAEQIQQNQINKETSSLIRKKLSRRYRQGIIRNKISTNKSLLREELYILNHPINLSIPNNSSKVIAKKIYPLKISDIEHIVKANNPDLEVYRREIKQQEYNLNKEISSWYPTLDFVASTQNSRSDKNAERDLYRDEDLDEETTNELGITQTELGYRDDLYTEEANSKLSLELNWDLIDPSRIPNIAAARDTYQKAKNSYLIQLRDLKLEALNAYFSLQQSDEGVRIGKASQKASQVSLDDAKARYQAGIGTKLDVLEAETQLARDERLLTEKLSDQSINQRTLAKILNLPYEFTPIADSPIQTIGIWNKSLEDSIFAALEFRKELENLRLDISINNNTANAALASAQPKLTLFNTLDKSFYEDIKSKNSPDQDSTSINHTYGLKANWRLFDGWNANSSYNYNKQVARVSEAKFVSEKNKIRQEIETDFFQLQSAIKDLASSNSEVVAAKESLRLARLRFKAGLTTQREVVNNQRDLTQAEVVFAEAISAYNTSISNLSRKTGMNYIKNCHSSKEMTSKDENSNLKKSTTQPFLVITSCPETLIKD